MQSHPRNGFVDKEGITVSVQVPHALSFMAETTSSSENTGHKEVFHHLKYKVLSPAPCILEGSLEAGNDALTHVFSEVI